MEPRTLPQMESIREPKWSPGPQDQDQDPIAILLFSHNVGSQGCPKWGDPLYL